VKVTSDENLRRFRFPQNTIITSFHKLISGFFCTDTMSFRNLSSVAQGVRHSSFKVVVVGGGTGGLAVSASLSKKLGPNKVAIVEPSEGLECLHAHVLYLALNLLKKDHFYQPLWTFVGGGMQPFEASRKPTAEVIPTDAEWIRDSVISIDPKNNKIFTKDNHTVSFIFTED
jgi:sulfide:quinone oxidoreductase